MHTNETTVICFQRMIAVGPVDNSTSNDNSTQVVAITRSSPKSQLWIPYVLIGFGCVIFLAVHFWCYHKRNRARYLRKREEIRVKCGLLERRRIATLMMARNRSEQLDAENIIAKEESEKNALLANPFYTSQEDNDYYPSQREENSYYESLLDRRTGIRKPHIGCCLTCSVSMPAGVKSSIVGKDKKEGGIHQSRSFCDSKYGNLERSDQFLKFLEHRADDGDSSQGCRLEEEEKENNVSVQFETDDDFHMDCPCTVSGCSSTDLENVHCDGGSIDQINGCSLLPKRESWGFSAVVSDFTPVEDNFMFKPDTFHKNSHGHRNQRFHSDNNSNKGKEKFDSNENNGQNYYGENVPSTSCFSHPTNKNESINPSRGNWSNLYTGIEACTSLELDAFPPDNTLNPLSSVNTIVANDRKEGDDNDSVGDLQDASSIHQNQTEPVDSDKSKQTGLKTPNLRSLNPRLVFENLHYNAK